MMTPYWHLKFLAGIWVKQVYVVLLRAGPTCNCVVIMRKDRMNDDAILASQIPSRHLG